MFDPISDGRNAAKRILSEAFIRIAAQSCVSDRAVPDFSVTAPNDPSFGDLSTNAPLVFAKVLGLRTESSASLLAESMNENNDLFTDISSPAPGFLGFRFSAAGLLSCAESLLRDEGTSDRSGRTTVFLWGRNDLQNRDYSPEELRTLSVFASLRRILEASGADITVNPLSDVPFDCTARSVAVFSEKDWDQNLRLKAFGENVEKVVVQTWKTTLPAVRFSADLGFLLCLTRPGRPSFMPDDLPFKETKENPSYFLKYVYSWIGNSLNGLSRRYVMPYRFQEAYEPDSPERDLLFSCLRFPSRVLTSCSSLDPSVSARYLMDLALQYEHFYRSCRLAVRNDTEKTLFRMRLAFLVRSILSRGMDLFGLEYTDEL